MIKRLLKYYIKNIIWNDYYILELKELFNELNKYEYIIIKTDTPYSPKNFPNEYPIGKDLDIFSSEKDYKKVNEVLFDFADKYKNKFNIRVIEQDAKYRVRLEKFGQLYYQLDNNYLTDNNTSSVFIEDAIQNRIFVNGYYTIPIEYEIVFRLSEIKSYPHKKHHIDYVKKNLDKVNVTIIPENLTNVFFKIKEGEL